MCMWYQKSWERVPNGILNVPCVPRAFRWTIHATKSTVELGFPCAQANWITPKTTSPSFLVRPHQPHLHRFDWDWQPIKSLLCEKQTAEGTRPCRFYANSCRVCLVIRTGGAGPPEALSDCRAARGFNDLKLEMIKSKMGSYPVT